MKLKPLLIIMLSICLLGCISTYNVKEEEYNYITKVNGFVGTLPKGKVIGSVDELIYFITESSYNDHQNFVILQEYDEQYFKTKSLVVQPWCTTSNGDYFIIESYKINGKEIQLNIKQTVWGVTTALGERYMILEIDSKKVENVDTVTGKWINKK